MSDTLLGVVIGALVAMVMAVWSLSRRSNIQDLERIRAEIVAERELAERMEQIKAEAEAARAELDVVDALPDDERVIELAKRLNRGGGGES